MSENQREPESMRDVDHTHPYTGETFGAVYRRGPAVADGGGDEPTGPAETLSDVDHTPDHGDAPNSVWERGEERAETASDGGTGPDRPGVGDE